MEYYRHREKYVSVERPPYGSANGITYSTTRSSQTETITVEETIGWGGNGKQIPHPCSAHTVRPVPLPGAAPVKLGSYDVHRSTASDARIDEWNLTKTTVYYPACRPPLTKEVGFSEEDSNKAIEDAMIRIQSLPIQGMMNLPQAIIELKDIPKTVKAVPKLARFLKGGIKHGLTAANTVKEIASAYLAYVFGINPTVNDVNSFMGQVPPRVGLGVRQVRYKRGQPVRTAVTLRSDELGGWTSAYTKHQGWYAYAVSSGAWLRDRTPGLDWSALSTGIAAKGTTDSRDWPWLARYKIVSREARGVVFGRVANDFAHDFSWLEDIRLNADPISTGWELVPFSFVIDWFVDIGRWLQQANRLNNARKLGFCLENGIWISLRNELVTYWPCLTQFYTEVTEDQGGAYPARYNLYTEKRVDMKPSSREVAYERHFLTDRVIFPKLDLKGISQQGTFQWASGTALAIQACGS